MFLERLLIKIAISYSEGKSVNYYLKKTGGYSRLADNNRVVIIQPNGETFSNTNEFFTLFQEEYLMPGLLFMFPSLLKKLMELTLQLYHQL